jgi:hypothetical protein
MLSITAAARSIATRFGARRPVAAEYLVVEVGADDVRAMKAKGREEQAADAKRIGERADRRGLHS